MSEEEIEELFPLIAELTNKYTSGESTSVTYETANKLMSAIIYCINEYENTNKLSLSINRNSMGKKYEIGLELVINKIKETQSMYNELIINFDAYENENYYDTVVRAISGFFKYYDYKFEPQNSIITCDYPTIISLFNTKKSGIDLINLYVNYIKIEQSFLSQIPKELIMNILYKYDCNYRKQFYNISLVILRHILGCMMIKKNIMDSERKTDYQVLFKIINEMNEKKLINNIKKLLSNLIIKYYNEDKNIYNYFEADIPEFVVQMKNVSEEIFLHNVVVL